MRGLVREYAVGNNTGKIAQVPVYPVVSAEDLTEGTDMAGTSADQTITTTTKNITLKEVGIMTNLTDFIRDTSEQNVVSHLGRLFGEAIAKKIDTDLIALFAGFSFDAGASNTEMTPQDLFEAAAKLRSNNAPGPYYGVFHPNAIFNVKKVLATQGNTAFGGNGQSELANEALRTGFVGSIAGIQIFESSNFTVDGDDDSVGGVFSQEALGLAMQNDLSMEMQRNASLRSEEVVATARYGVAELIDSYGVRIQADTLAN